MSNGQLLVTTILLQQGLLGGAWLWVAMIGLSSRAARAWGLAAWLLAAACLVLLMRRDLGVWLGTLAPNLLALLAFIAVHRGVRTHAQAAPRDGAQAVVLAVTTAAIVAAIALGTDGPAWRWIIVSSSAAYAWTLLSTAVDAQRLFGPRFGRLNAALCAGPVTVLGLLFLLRAAWVALGPVPDASRSGDMDDIEITLGIGFLVMGLLLNLSLAALVTQGVMRTLQDMSLRDPLTGLLNRRGMAQALDAEAQRLQRQRAPGAVLMLDIDHFKRVNDTHGHAAGDAVIVAVAVLLRTQLRQVDRMARMGGEEFAALLVAAPLAEAHAVAERVRAATEVLQVPWNGRALRVTISIGVAALPEPPGTLAEGLQRADAELYAAKARGRNRAVGWEDLAPGEAVPACADGGAATPGHAQPNLSTA
jgi:diguanylate cyclase (GGDEF)-like protein